MDASQADYDWALDREIVLSRVFDAPRALVFKAWTDENIGRWFGPRGYTIKTHERDVRVGGRWRFDMVMQGGQVYSNRIVYLEIREPELLVFDHGADVDDDPRRFRVILSFDTQGDGKTVLTLRQLHPGQAQREAAIGFGAVELGYQTLDKLAEHLSRWS